MNSRATDATYFWSGPGSAGLPVELAQNGMGTEAAGEKKTLTAAERDHVELDDLVSAGIVGLIDAFGKFDHSKKVQFKSYAQFRIRGAILDSLRVLDWSPRELRRKGRAMEEAIQTLTRKQGRTPTETEIAAEMQITLGEYQQMIGELKGLEIGSLNMERSEDSGDEELAYVPGPMDADPLFRCMQGEMRQRLVDAIEELPEKERMVLTLYYYEELTMKEIGLTLGVVESRISQIHSSALGRLRGVMGPAKAAGRSREMDRMPLPEKNLGRSLKFL
jgi:RNA polymerase sigma factor for flagellar operon FliA